MKTKNKQTIKKLKPFHPHRHIENVLHSKHLRCPHCKRARMRLVDLAIALEAIHYPELHLVTGRVQRGKIEIDVDKKNRPVGEGARDGDVPWRHAQVGVHLHPGRVQDAVEPDRVLLKESVGQTILHGLDAAKGHLWQAGWAPHV